MTAHGPPPVPISAATREAAALAAPVAVARVESAARSGASPRPTVLIINKGELLGDALQRVPAYRALRFAFPHHRIVSICLQTSAYAAALAPVRHLFLDDVLTHQPIAEGPSRLRALAEELGTLDVVLDLRGNLRFFQSWLAFGSAPRFVANTAGLFIRRGVAGFAEIRPHWNAERYHRIAEIAAGRRLPFDGTLPEQPAAAALAEKLLPPGTRYFGIASSPLSSHKAWPRDNYMAVAAAIRGLGLRPVVLLGRDEVEQHAWFAEHIPDAIVLDLSAAGGDMTLLPWLLHAAAGRLAGCLANESGLGHLVASRSIPLLTLAGPTNPLRWKPITPTWWFLRGQDFGSNATSAIPPAAVCETIVAMMRWRDAAGAAAVAVPTLERGTVNA